jgi:hypothetical protein
MFRALQITFGIAIVIFLLMPIFAILPLAFTSSVFLNYPIPAYSMRWMHELTTADVWRTSIVNSLIIGSGATVLATVLGTLASLGMRKGALPMVGLLRTLFLLPMVVPAVVLGVGMQIFLVRLGLASTYLGVIIAHSVLCIRARGEQPGGSARHGVPARDPAAGCSGCGVGRDLRLRNLPRRGCADPVRGGPEPEDVSAADVLEHPREYQPDSRRGSASPHHRYALPRRARCSAAMASEAKRSQDSAISNMTKLSSWLRDMAKASVHIPVNRGSKTKGLMIMRGLPNSIQARDVEYVLHPVTNARKHEEIGPIVIDRGEGIYVYDDQGNRYLEALAGLWSVAVGFGEKRLVEAAARQMAKLPYYHTFSHKTNEPSVLLAERLVKMTPDRLKRAFFTNSGSEANDSVIKMVWYYNNARGLHQKK